MRFVIAMVMFTCVLCFYDAGFVLADTGVSMEPSFIAAKRPLAPGSKFTLPALKVTNNGENETTFFMSAVNVGGQAVNEHKKGAPRNWLSFVPATFSLAPGESEAVEVLLDLPTAAGSGDYEVGIQAAAGVDQESEGFNIALVSILQFSVRENDSTKTVFPAAVLVLAFILVTGYYLARKTHR